MGRAQVRRRRCRTEAEHVVLLGSYQHGRLASASPRPFGLVPALGVREAWGKVHVIELAQQGPLVAHPVEDDAVGVREHQADRLGGQGPVESRQHLLAAFEEQES